MSLLKSRGIIDFEFCKELRGEFTSNYKFNKNEKRKIQSNDYLNLIEYLKEKVKLLSIPLNRHKDLIELKSEDYDNFTQTLTFGMKKDIKDIDTALKNVKDELYHNYNEIINENKKEEENLRTDILQQLIKDIINLNNLIDVDIKAEKEKKSSEKVENSENKAKKPIKNQKKNLIKNYEVLINEYSDENLIKNIESIPENFLTGEVVRPFDQVSNWGVFESEHEAGSFISSV